MDQRLNRSLYFSFGLTQKNYWSGGRVRESYLLQESKTKLIVA